MSITILILIISFLVSLLTIPSIIKVAHEKSLLDKPTELRKIHTRSVPNLGGISIFIGFFFSTLLFRVLCDSVELSVLCAASVLMFFIALKDDLVSTPAFLRLTYQFVLAGIIVLVGQIYFFQIPLFQPNGTFQTIVDILFSIVFIVALTNALNFIDGIDGLAASLSIFIFTMFGLIFYQYGDLSYANVAFALAGSTFAFLLFNWNPAKIFMGDIGSMLLGIFMSAFAIKLSNLEPLRSGFLPVYAPTSVALALIIVPLMDMVTVILVRLRLRLSPFYADKRHLHHRLITLGFSQRNIVLFILFFNMLTVGIAVLLGNISSLLSFLMVVMAALILEAGVLITIRKKHPDCF